MPRLTAQLAAGLLVTVMSAAAAGEDIRVERVTFARGASSASIQGHLAGRETVDYRVRAGAGQTMTVKFSRSHAQAYFNVMPPDSSDVAMFVGQTGGGEFARVLPGDGDYTVRVYLMRAAARRDEKTDFTLTIGVTGKPLAALPGSKDAVIPGTRFHASMPAECALPYRSGPVSCEAFVTRRGHDGTATVEFRSDGLVVRRLLFVKGQAVSSDSPLPLEVARDGDRSTVRFGQDERFVVHDMLLTGG